MTIDNNKDYMQQKLSTNFGVEDLANKFLKSNTAVISKYLLDEEKVNNIIKMLRSKKVSPEFFLAYSIAEGGGAGGFINHYQNDESNDYLEIAKRDADYLLGMAKPVKITSNASNSSAGAFIASTLGIANMVPELARGDIVNIAWDDPGGGIVGKVPKDVQTKAEQEVSGWSPDTIGRIYLQSTAAAAWGTYYPQLLKKSVNGVADFGNPVDQTRNIINGWSPNEKDYSNDSDKFSGPATTSENIQSILLLGFLFFAD